MGVAAAHDIQTVLKAIGHHVHLVDSNAKADTDVVFTPNHGECIGKRIHIGATLKRSETTVAQRPVGGHQEGTQTATQAIFGGLGQARRSVGTLAVEIGSDNAESVSHADWGAKFAERCDVVEDAVKPDIHLVNVVGIDDVGFREHDVASVIANELVAAEGTLLGPSGGSARHKGVGLIIAETSE